MRKCIGCQTSFPQDELIRFTLQDGHIVADVAHSAEDDNAGAKATKNEGRGFYICRKGECLGMALKKRAFNRVCRRNVDENEIRQIVESLLSDTKED